MKSTTALFILLFCAAALYLPGISRSGFEEKDESRRALVAWEMFASGNYVVPTLNGEIYVNKPPVLYWLICGFAKISGQVDEVTSRLPSVMAVLLTALLLWRFGAKAYSSSTAGLLAAMVWLTSYMALSFGSRANIDIILTLFTTALLYHAYMAMREKMRSAKRLYIMGFLLGLGFLVKGPMVVIFILPILCYVLVVSFRQKSEGGLGAGRVAGHGFLALLVCAAVILLWVWPLLHGAGEEAKNAFLREVVERAEKGGFDHAEPWYFYLRSLLENFLPWTPVFIVGIIKHFRLRKEISVEERQATNFLLFFFFVSAVLFSIPAVKKSYYLLPIIPAAALVTGRALESLWEQKGGLESKIVRAFMLFLPIILGVVGLALVFAPTSRTDQLCAGSMMVHPKAWLTAGGVLLAIAGAAAIFFWRRDKFGLLPVFATIVLAGVIYNGVIASARDNRRSPARLIAQVMPNIGPTTPLVSYGSWLPAYNIYTGRRFTKMYHDSEKPIPDFDTARRENPPNTMFFIPVRFFKKIILPPDTFDIWREENVDLVVFRTKPNDASREQK